MKRDMDLIRLILLKVEEAKGLKGALSNEDSNLDEIILEYKEDNAFDGNEYQQFFVYYVEDIHTLKIMFEENDNAKFNNSTIVYLKWGDKEYFNLIKDKYKGENENNNITKIKKPSSFKVIFIIAEKNIKGLS